MEAFGIQNTPGSKNGGALILTIDVDLNLIKFLGRCVYGDPVAYYLDLSVPDRRKLLKEAQKNGYLNWIYRYLQPVLKPEISAVAGRAYQTSQAAALSDECGLRRLYRVLAQAGLRFVPIKGVDLAFRVYPDAALRNFVDWDIWFHPDDCEAALPVLRQDGWLAPYLETRRKTARQHYAAHCRGDKTLEPHCTLSRFGKVDPLKLWEHTVPDAEIPGMRRLTPELNFLMLNRHASANCYRFAKIPQLLVDTAFLMQKTPVDFAGSRRLSEQWQLPYAGDLPAAYPEFFPPEILAELQADPVRSAAYRNLFDFRAKLPDSSLTSWRLADATAQGQLGRQAIGFLKNHRATVIRSRYYLPERGAYGRLAWAYCRYLAGKTVAAFRLLSRSDGKLREYCRKLRKLEPDCE